VQREGCAREHRVLEDPAPSHHGAAEGRRNVLMMTMMIILLMMIMIMMMMMMMKMLFRSSIQLSPPNCHQVQRFK
jgi:hypothetical protein